MWKRTGSGEYRRIKDGGIKGMVRETNTRTKEESAIITKTYKGNKTKFWKMVNKVRKEGGGRRPQRSMTMRNASEGELPREKDIKGR